MKVCGLLSSFRYAPNLLLNGVEAYLDLVDIEWRSMESFLPYSCNHSKDLHSSMLPQGLPGCILDSRTDL